MGLKDFIDMNNTITLEQLCSIYTSCSRTRALLFLPFLNATMSQYEINTPARKRMFLAQVGHESGQLTYVKELASGLAYEGRKDLGNTALGDGSTYKGRGLIQLTGKANYIAASLDLDLPLLDKPELLETPEYACRVAGWFWNKNNCNSLCDLGLFEELTKRINGGMNGYPDRYKLYQRALQAIN